MAYFLKKSNYKKGTYLQIYESFYDPERKAGAHRSYKALGYVHELQAQVFPMLLVVGVSRGAVRSLLHRLIPV